jgi:hypothetical protein
MTGIIHNPHYYEWLRGQNHGVLPRAPGDLPCGGYVNIRILRDSMRFDTTTKYREIIEDFHRFCHEIETDIYHSYFRQVNANPNTIRTINVNYLLNKYDEKHWGMLLLRNDKQYKINNEILEIMNAYKSIAIDILNSIVTYYQTNITNVQSILYKNSIDQITNPAVLEKIRNNCDYMNNKMTEISNFMIMINEALFNVSKYYSAEVPYLHVRIINTNHFQYRTNHLEYSSRKVNFIRKPFRLPYSSEITENSITCEKYIELNKENIINKHNTHNIY